MTKRIWISIAVFLAIPLLCSTIQAKEYPLWKEYKSNFISRDGRVVDSYQEEGSHSEGQGYGMLLALAHNDKETFDSLWQWATNNLAVRTDNLFAWKWGKRTTGRWEVIDFNNATDGDILIAYALCKAADKWGESSYQDAALEIIEGIQNRLTIAWQGKTLLLPGYEGFISDDGFVINPSYFVFPAFKTFAKARARQFWVKVYQ